MAYAAWSVVAGEQPTAAKWNILGTNDASFNDGSGLAFTTNGVVPGNALSTTAITLGSATTTTTQSSITTETDLTSLSVTVTVPDGGRNIEVIGAAWINSTVSGDIARLFIKESTTYLASYTFALPVTPNAYNAYFATLPFAASAGSHTYKLSLTRSNGSGSLASNAGTESATTTRPFIVVRAV